MPDNAPVRRLYRLMTMGILLLCPATGCGRSNDGPHVVIETLASGVVQTTYRTLPEIPLPLDTLAVWDVWSGDSGYLFSRLTTAVGADDEFFLLDSGNRQVVATDVRGRVRRAFGGRGEGPGEFGFPRFLDLVSAELWVGDIMPMRFSVFGPDGTFRRTVPSRVALVPDQERCAVLPDGRVLNTADAFEGPLSLIAWDLVRGTGDTLAVIATLPPVILELTRSDGRLVPFDTRPTFAAGLHWSWSEAGGLITVTSLDYVFESRDLEGRVIRRTSAPTAELNVTEADRERFFEETSFTSGDGATISSDELRRHWVFAERRQAVAGVRVDPLGRIWVLAETPQAGAPRLDLFDPDHHYLGSPVASILPFAFLSDGTPLFRVAGEDDGPTVLFTARRP
jgi:hypothetical protein